MKAFFQKIPHKETKLLAKIKYDVLPKINNFKSINAIEQFVSNELNIKSIYSFICGFEDYNPPTLCEVSSGIFIFFSLKNVRYNILLKHKK